MRKAITLVSVVILLAVGSVLTFGLIRRHWSALTHTQMHYAPDIVKMSSTLRRVLGYGPHELAMYGVEAATHGDIANAAAIFCQDHQETVEPLINAATAALRDRLRAYELRQDPTDAESTVASAINNLASDSAGAIQAMNGYLNATQISLRDTRLANAGLDVPLAIIELTAEQRAALVTAQRERDGVLLHHCERKDLPLVNQAMLTFDAATAAALTAEQRSAYTANQSTLNDNLAAVLSAEEAWNSGFGQ